MRTTFVCLLAIASLAAPALAQTRGAKPLEIYVVDVEGGNATLFVTPSGETVLIDTGNGGAQAARDAGRIMEAAKDAGILRCFHDARCVASGLRATVAGVDQHGLA